MRTKIMVVEDDRDLRRNMQYLLEGEGYDVALAENGQVALDHLEETSEIPALIFLDLMMPVMDGFGFRKLQEQSPKFGFVPVVILSADDRIEEKKIKLGTAASLKKPAGVDAILGMIEKIIGPGAGTGSGAGKGTDSGT